MKHINHVRTVAKNVQVSLGKEFAGKQIQIFKQDENTLLIKTVLVIPKSEMWLHNDGNPTKIDSGIKWAESTLRQDNFEEIMNKAESILKSKDNGKS